MQTLTKTLGEVFVRSCCRQVQSIPARLWRLKTEENGGAHAIAAANQSATAKFPHPIRQGRYGNKNSHFITHVAVPFDTAHVVLDLVIHSTRGEVTIHRQQLGEVLDLAAMLVNMQSTKVPAKLSLCLLPNVREVLVPEHDDAPLRRQQGQLVFLSGRQLAELEAADLGAGRGRDLLEGGAGGTQQCSLVRVRAAAGVVVLELLERRLFAGDVVREVRCVFVLRVAISADFIIK